MHFCCLPQIKDGLKLKASDTVSPEEVEPLRKRLAAEPPPDPALPETDLQLAEELQEDARLSLEAGELVNAGWWLQQPWIYTDLPPQQQAVQIPKRFRAEYDALKIQLMHAVVGATVPESPEAVAGWKALLNLDALLMAGPTAAHRAEGLTTQSALLETRLRMARGGEWGALVADVRRRPGQDGSAAGPRLPASPAQLAQKRATRVATLATSGEVNRSLRACVATGKALTDASTLPLLKQLYPSQPLPAAPAQQRVPDDALARQAAEQATRFLAKPARLSAPGLVAGRAEHWTGVARDPAGQELLKEIFRRILAGELPKSALECLRSGEIVALPKSDDKVRPIVLTPVLRRYALRGLMAAIKRDLEDAVGTMQFGCGTIGGVEAAVLAVRLAAQQFSHAAVLALDTSAAFQHIRRDTVFEECDKHLPHMTPFMRVWYQHSTTHIWRDERGQCHQVECTGGVEQGDPLAPLAYALATRPALARLRELMRQRDSKATVVAFLDDTYLVQPVRDLEATWRDANDTWRSAGLPLNAAKCKTWLPAGPGPPPPRPAPAPSSSAEAGAGPEAAVHAAYPGLPPTVPTLPLLGGHLRVAGDAEDAPSHLGAQAGCDLDQATARLDNLWAQLRALLVAGLPKHVAGALLRSYAGAASQFVLRLSPTTPAATARYDATLKQIWDHLIERPMSAPEWRRACLPCKLGGLGLQSATDRHLAAAWCGLSAALPVASKALSASARELWHLLPGNEAAGKALLDGMRAQGCKEAFVHMDLQGALDTKTRQRSIVRHAHQAVQRELLASMTPAQQAWLRSTAGPGAGAFLEQPPGEDMTMHDDSWTTAVRLRLGLPHAAHAVPPPALPSCQHVSGTGAICNKECDATDTHALHCNLGGGTLARHNAMARQLGRILHEAYGVQARFEQRVPHLDRVVNGTDQRAVMDVVYTAAEGRSKYIDVALVSACAGSAARVEEAARRQGAAAHRACAAKTARYGDEVLPFVLELGGCASAPVREWVREAAAQLDADPDSYECHGPKLWGRISVTLQRFVALQLRRAAGIA